MGLKLEEAGGWNNLDVHTTGGDVRGFESYDLDGQPLICYLGIPYARTPKLERRFADPDPRIGWGGLLVCDEDGNTCPSRHVITGRISGNENQCLNLNVYTKRLPDYGQARPVMVFIHGGGFQKGSNEYKIYGPQYLITQNIVLVVVNYRTGAFGFLALKDPKLEVRGNAGLKDIVCALKWVKRNIELFSGDPNNVTIFGQGAGAAAVHFLNLSPMARGLYHKAIAQSGSPLNYWSMGVPNNGSILATMLDLDLFDNEKEVLEKLQDVPAERIVKVQHQLDGRGIIFGPVVEDPSPSHQQVFLTDTPINLLRRGEFNKVPMMIGYTNREGLLYELKRVHNIHETAFTDDEKLFIEMPLELGLRLNTDQTHKVLQSVRKYYFDNKDPFAEECSNYLSTLRSDVLFIHPIYRTIYHYLNNKSNHAPIYVYRFSLDTGANTNKILCTCNNLTLFMWMMKNSYQRKCLRQCFAKRVHSMARKRVVAGACHGDDLCYLFKQFHAVNYKSGSAEDVGIRRVCRLWTNFARHGAPTPLLDDWLLDLDTFAWEPAHLPLTMVFDIGKKLRLTTNPEYNRMAHWDNAFTVVCKKEM